MESLADLRGQIEWHLIGPLQSNKARVVAASFRLGAHGRSTEGRRAACQQLAPDAPAARCRRACRSTSAARLSKSGRRARSSAARWRRRWPRCRAAAPARADGDSRAAGRLRGAARTARRTGALLFEGCNAIGLGARHPVDGHERATWRRRSPRAPPSCGWAARFSANGLAPGGVRLRSRHGVATGTARVPARHQDALAGYREGGGAQRDLVAGRRCPRCCFSALDHDLVEAQVDLVFGPEEATRSPAPTRSS